jgi:OOP family OmpA-OmpF porin
MKRALLAATMLGLPVLVGVPVAARAQPIQGLYVGGSVGANFLEQERLRGGSIGSNPGYNPGLTGLASIGYALGNGVRLEVEGSYRSNGIDDSGKPVGITSQGGRETKIGAMGNVLFDMDIGSPYVFPYLGAGAGYQHVDQRYEQTDVGGPRVSLSAKQGYFAYQAIAGAAFPIPGVVGLSATAEYRYLGLAGDRSETGSSVQGAVVTPVTRRVTEDNNHSLMIGLRYAFNVVPPAPPPAPVAAVSSPAPAAARSYLVFFDWDRADLTPRARQIIAEAAESAQRTSVTRIEVSGYADRSGTPVYNQALSLRRAQAVQGELISKGVPQQAISVQAFGDTHPLVPTAAGVREPQNRRVEIVFR